MSFDPVSYAMGKQAGGGGGGSYQQGYEAGYSDGHTAGYEAGEAHEHDALLNAGTVGDVVTYDPEMQAYELAGQSGETYTQNGVYDTTTVNVVQVQIAGVFSQAIAMGSTLAAVDLSDLWNAMDTDKALHWFSFAPLIVSVSMGGQIGVVPGYAQFENDALVIHAGYSNTATELVAQFTASTPTGGLVCNAFKQISGSTVNDLTNMAPLMLSDINIVFWKED